MKLPFRKNKEFLTVLYDILGFYPHNIEVYRIAFSHKSISHTAYSKERKPGGKHGRVHSDYTPRPLNNERLEFLGDAVIEAVVSDILFRHFQYKREGFLTSTRSKIVQREALNRLAVEMGLDQLIHAAQGTDTAHTNIGGNAFEALMGAIYLDRGYKHCHWFVSNRIIGHYIDIDNVAKKEVNFKSKILEWSQKNRIEINFRDFSRKSEGKGFGTVLTIEGITVSRGDGRSKKESQQEASREALTRMRRDAKFYDSLFRSKEKRTAMEAEESFALPKIEEIEEEIANPGTRKKKNKTKPPVLEKRKTPSAEELSEEAYDAAYDENANYEVIETPPKESMLTDADYAAKGLPAPPEANDFEDDEEKVRRSRQRNRKTAPDIPVQGKDEPQMSDGLKAKKEKTENPSISRKTKKKGEETAQNDGNKSGIDDVSASKEKNGLSERNGFANGFVIVKDVHQATPDDIENEEGENSDGGEKMGIAAKAPAKASLAEEADGEKNETLPDVVGQEGSSPKENEEVSESVSGKEEAVTESNQESGLEGKPGLYQGEAGKSGDIHSFSDDSDFEVFEVDNLPDITGNDETEEDVPPVSEKEEDISGKDGETDFSGRPSVSEPSVRPQLRHISLDDFVFGIDSSEIVSLDGDEQATGEETVASKSQKPRRRKRKTATPDVEESGQDKESPKRRVQRKKDSEGSEKSGKEGKKSVRPARQPRRRRPSANNGKNETE